MQHWYTKDGERIIAIATTVLDGQWKKVKEN